MRLVKLSPVFLLGIFALAGISQATIPEKYQTIVERNSFGLNPPAPMETNPAPVIPPSDIKLTGFTQMSGQSKAYFVIQAKDAKQPPRYVSLTAGGKDGVLELIQILEKNGEVKVKNTGVEMVLSLKNNGMKPGPQPAAPAVAAANGAPASVIFSPTGSGKAPTATAAPSAVTTMAPGPGAANANPASSVIYNNGGYVANHRATEASPDPVKQYLGMLIQEEVAKKEGRDFPPTPPLPGAPPAVPIQPEAPNGVPQPPAGPPPIPR